MPDTPCPIPALLLTQELGPERTQIGTCRAGLDRLEQELIGISITAKLNQGASQQQRQRDMAQRPWRLSQQRLANFEQLLMTRFVKQRQQGLAALGKGSLRRRSRAGLGRNRHRPWHSETASSGSCHGECQCFMSLTGAAGLPQPEGGQSRK